MSHGATWRTRHEVREIATTSAPAPSARPNVLSGKARVLLRIASANADREFWARGAISGDEFAMGWTPTASTTPTNTNSAA